MTITKLKNLNLQKNYFVTSFDAYSLKRGLETLAGLEQVITLTKVIFARDMSGTDDDYLNYLALGYRVKWEDENIYFPLSLEDMQAIMENQRVAKVKFRNLSVQYRSSLMYILTQITDEMEYSNIKKVFKQLEKGV